MTTYHLLSSKPSVKLIQFTDSHLFKSVDEELLGVNTQNSFQQVLTEISQSNFDFELCLATGDLVQDSSQKAYKRFANMVQCFQKPIFWLPGNHDFLPQMATTLTEDCGYLSAKKHLLIGDYWQIILLDSQIFGVPHGQLSQYQLDWLAEKLQQNPDRFTLIVLHHHILPTYSAWLDQHNLRNANELLQIINAYPKVKSIVYGHIHQQVDSQWNSYQIMATPSTCIQFKPDSNHFALDDLQPGWREIELHNNGEITTEVKRIKQASFLPDNNTDGY